MLDPLADHVELALEARSSGDVGRRAPTNSCWNDRLGGHRARRRARCRRSARRASRGRCCPSSATIRSNDAPRPARRASARLAAGRRARRRSSRRRAARCRAAPLPCGRSVRHLDQDAGAVAGVGLAAAGAAVLQVDQDLERLADDRVRPAALERGRRTRRRRRRARAAGRRGPGRREAGGVGTVLLWGTRARSKTDSTHRYPCVLLVECDMRTRMAPIVPARGRQAGLDSDRPRPCYGERCSWRPASPSCCRPALARARVVARVRCRRPAGEKPRTASFSPLQLLLPLSSRLSPHCEFSLALSRACIARGRPAGRLARRAARIPGNRCRAHGTRMLTSTIVEPPATGAAARAPPGPSARARSREHPHHPGGRRRVRTPGDALLDRQGLVGAAAAGAEGVLSRPIPFPLLHIDTTYKFREMIEFRDWYADARRRAADRPHQRGGDRRRHAAVRGRHPALLRPAQDPGPARRARGGNFDAAFGGARRDEERSRAKERVFSLRDPQGPVHFETPAA